MSKKITYNIDQEDLSNVVNQFETKIIYDDGPSMLAEPAELKDDDESSMPSLEPAELKDSVAEPTEIKNEQDKTEDEHKFIIEYNDYQRNISPYQLQMRVMANSLKHLLTTYCIYEDMSQRIRSTYNNPITSRITRFVKPRYQTYVNDRNIPVDVNVYQVDSPRKNSVIIFMMSGHECNSYLLKTLYVHLRNELDFWLLKYVNYLRSLDKRNASFDITDINEPANAERKREYIALSEERSIHRQEIEELYNSDENLHDCVQPCGLDLLFYTMELKFIVMVSDLWYDRLIQFMQTIMTEYDQITEAKYHNCIGNLILAFNNIRNGKAEKLIRLFDNPCCKCIMCR